MKSLKYRLIESMSTNKLSVGDIINVHGFVMMAKMEGSLKVSKIDEVSYYFTKPKGTTVVVRHTIDNVDRWIDNKSDINYIEIVKK